MSKPLTTYTGVLDRIRWRSEDESNRLIAVCEDGTSVIGAAQEGELTNGITYDFFGKWLPDHEKHGKQFKFDQFIIKEQHSKTGVVAYLARYCDGIGPFIAAKLFDAFQGEAVRVLRTQPEAALLALQGRWMTLDKLQHASKQLQEIAAMEDTKISLTNLFSGRGFPGAMIEDAIKKWGILAPARIRRDPFCLLVEEMPGAGFGRCDRLYMDLGLPPDRLKRQLICLWSILKDDTSGNTWHDLAATITRLGEKIGGTQVKPKKVVKLGKRAKWLALKRDEDGRLWVAEVEAAEAEKNVAERVGALREWEPPKEDDDGERPKVAGREVVQAT